MLAVAPVKKIEPRPSGRLARAAAHARRSAGEEDRAAAMRQHGPRRLAPGQEAGVARHLPHLAEHALGGVQQGEGDVAADVEHAHLQRRDGVRARHEGGDLRFLPGVERLRDAPSAGRLDLGRQRGQLLPMPPPGDDDVAFGREALGDGGADVVARPHHDGRRVTLLDRIIRRVIHGA